VLLVDHVLPAVDYRQWVLSFSGTVAVRLGYDRELLAAVSERLARAVLQDMRRSVKHEHGLASVAPLHGGVVTVVQRFRSDLGLYVHLHLLVTDGACEECREATITPRRIGWASLLARVFAIDVTVCSKCGGRMKIL